MIEKIFRLFDKHFGKASMLAKLSLVFNIALSYVAAVLYDKTEENKAKADVMKDEVIKVHVQRYNDFENLMIRLNYLKAKVENDTPNSQIANEIQSIANDQKKSVIKK